MACDFIITRTHKSEGDNYNALARALKKVSTYRKLLRERKLRRRVAPSGLSLLPASKILT